MLAETYIQIYPGADLFQTQNNNQVHWNGCAGVLQHTPSSGVVSVEQPRDLFRNKMTEHCLQEPSRHLIYTGVGRSTFKHPVLLVLGGLFSEYSKIIKSSPPQISVVMTTIFLYILTYRTGRIF